MTDKSLVAIHRFHCFLFANMPLIVYTRTRTRSVSGFGSRTHAKWKSRSTGGLSNRVEFLGLYTQCESVEAIDTHHCL